ncbi:MAG: DUF6057 family protein [Tannerellaceae bacterium]|jgi:hypothetical protein|nr:DUF6057 family protein [Tannerellaceae bacterium]
MMETLKHKGLLFWAAVYLLLFAFLQTGHAFHFYFVEQNQMFLHTWPYVAEHLLQPGGVALMLSEYLLQFFILPYAGAVITAALLTGVGCLAYGLGRRIAPGANLLIACLLPLVALLFAHFDFNYFLYGTVAFLLMEATLYLVLGIGRPALRLGAQLLATPILFGLAGPVALLYALSAAVYELFGRSKPSYLVLLAVGEALLIGILSVYFALYGEYRHALLPDGYYHLSLAPRSVIYFSWCAFPAVILLACILGRRKAVRRKRLWTESVVQGVCLAALCVWGIPEYADKKSAMLKELDYYCRTEQWDKILKRCEGTLSNYLYIGYANLALAQKGELGERMFAYDQRGTQGLLVNWNKTSSISILLSELYFAMNEVAPAQEMAFEAYVSATGYGNPRMLKRLVQTNLIYGAYAVAEKYLAILEQTYAYRAWAKAHRPFLYNDALVAADPLLGSKRRSLMPVRKLALIDDGIDVELQQIAQANPKATASIHFAGAFYLLAKDMNRFQALIETYFDTPVLPVLPLAFQEAVIILSENAPDYPQRFRISEAVIRRFAAYRQQVVANNRGGNSSALPGLMRRSYGDTYWFYFMFK